MSNYRSQDKTLCFDNKNFNLPVALGINGPGRWRVRGTKNVPQVDIKCADSDWRTLFPEGLHKGLERLALNVLEYQVSEVEDSEDDEVPLPPKKWRVMRSVVDDEEESGAIISLYIHTIECFHILLHYRDVIDLPQVDSATGLRLWPVRLIGISNSVIRYAIGVSIIV